MAIFVTGVSVGAGFGMGGASTTVPFLPPEHAAVMNTQMKTTESVLSID
jgi:hypothetical protein